MPSRPVRISSSARLIPPSASDPGEQRLDRGDRRPLERAQPAEEQEQRESAQGKPEHGFVLSGRAALSHGPFPSAPSAGEGE